MHYVISDGSLVGDVRRSFIGDAKEWFMRSLGSLKQDRHTEAVALMLVPNTLAGVAAGETITVCICLMTEPQVSFSQYSSGSCLVLAGCDSELLLKIFCKVRA